MTTAQPRLAPVVGRIAPVLALALALASRVGAAGDDEAYFPPPDAGGGWRSLPDREEIARVAGIDVDRLDRAFTFIRRGTKNGGLLVERRGWLVYERYFGLASRDATPNLASVGKSFTSVAVGILVDDRPDLFPDGLDQKIWTPRYLPPAAFPPTDPAKEEIRLGHLLAFSAGIRGNNPGLVHGREVRLDPPGPDGILASTDEAALGLRDLDDGTTRTLWCRPGEGYSYATSSIHLAAMILRHVTGRELRDHLEERLAGPIGWGRWGYAYRQAGLEYTPGGGGIAARATDMLRFGYLLKHEGRWEGRSIVPGWYVRHASTASPYNPHAPYSLQFDVNSTGAYPGLPRDAFWKRGSGGHVLYVVPSLDLTVWKLGGRDDQYRPRNTGVPLPPPAGAPTPDAWRSEVPPDEAAVETLRRVIEAIDPPNGTTGASGPGEASPVR